MADDLGRWRWICCRRAGFRRSGTELPAASGQQRLAPWRTLTLPGAGEASARRETDALAQLPSIDRLLGDPGWHPLLAQFGQALANVRRRTRLRARRERLVGRRRWVFGPRPPPDSSGALAGRRPLRRRKARLSRNPASAPRTRGGNPVWRRLKREYASSPPRGFGPCSSHRYGESITNLGRALVVR